MSFVTLCICFTPEVCMRKITATPIQSSFSTTGRCTSLYRAVVAASRFVLQHMWVGRSANNQYIGVLARISMHHWTVGDKKRCTFRLWEGFFAHRFLKHHFQEKMKIDLTEVNFSNFIIDLMYLDEWREYFVLVYGSGQWEVNSVPTVDCIFSSIFGYIYMACLAKYLLLV
jgi:hypothetical protein